MRQVVRLLEFAKIDRPVLRFVFALDESSKGRGGILSARHDFYEQCPCIV